MGAIGVNGLDSMSRDGLEMFTSGNGRCNDLKHRPPSRTRRVLLGGLAQDGGREDEAGPGWFLKEMPILKTLGLE